MEDRQVSLKQVLDALEDYMDGNTLDGYEDSRTLIEILKALPSAQPERKKGKWTIDNSCPFCGFQPWYERDIHTLSYCPNCGARMEDGEADGKEET